MKKPVVFCLKTTLLVPSLSLNPSVLFAVSFRPLTRLPTAIFKSLISLKTRNAIIFSPHPRAKDATNKAADIVLQAAIAAGAPKDLIGWIDQPSVELSNALMHHPDINLILATGGPGMVKAAYSSGKPAIGVGAGNTPVVIDETADIKRAVASVLMSKTFDNGVICASEQSVVVVDSVYDAVRERFATHGGYLLQGKELKAVQDVILKNGALNAAIVGQPAYKIAELAGFSVPENTKILIGEVTVVDESEPFAHEKLSPTLAMYRAKDFEDAVEKQRNWLLWAVSVIPLACTLTRITNRLAFLTSVRK